MRNHKYLRKYMKGNKWIYIYHEGDQQREISEEAVGSLRDLAEAGDEEAKKLVDSLDPREEAAQDQEEQADYYNARQSQFSNFGEDVVGAARHRGARNLTEMRAGTGSIDASELREANPVNLIDSVESNAINAYLLNQMLKRFPDYEAGTRANEEQLRSGYLAAFEHLKGKIESLKNDTRPYNEIISDIRRSMVSKSNELRASGQPSFSIVANYVNNVLSTRVKRGSIANDFYELTQAVAKGKGLDRNGVVQFLGGIQGDEAIRKLIEGKKLNKVFNIESEGGGQRTFSLADFYVGKAERSGPSTGLSTSEKQAKFLTDSCELRAVQWGNSVTDEERKHHLEKSSEALKDLADVLGLPDKMISFNGRLALAIGARGKGTALAHYESQKMIINLTRKSGVGSLAHEWGHFLDNILAKTHNQGSGFLSVSSKNLRADGEVMAAMKELVSSPAWINFKQLTVDSFRDFKARGFKIKNLSYWTSTEEMFARAFETYVNDKLEKSGRKNTYLSGKNRGVFWPTQEMIDQMTPAFDKFFEKLRTSEHITKAMFYIMKSDKPFHGYNKEKHSRTGGLNSKYREKYNRETGSNLKEPVTESNPSEKRAARRRSFCARMSGVEGPTSKDGKLTPKGAALKRWKCKSELDECFDLIKATEGEGSRGGVIVGHTESGKPIYQSAGNAAHKTFSKQDHVDAALAHSQKRANLSDEYHAQRNPDGTVSQQHIKKRAQLMKQIQHHNDQAERHRSKAEGRQKAPDQRDFDRMDRKNDPQKRSSAWNRKSQGDEMDLLKGGEGSRGGRIIGHTRSGKPIYSNKRAGSYGGVFSSEDHHDAAALHMSHKGKANDNMDHPSPLDKMPNNPAVRDAEKHIQEHGLTKNVKERAAPGEAAAGRRAMLHDSSAFKRSQGDEMDQLKKLGISVSGQSLIKSSFTVQSGAADIYKGQPSRAGVAPNAADALSEQLSKGYAYSKGDDNEDNYGAKYTKNSHGEEFHSDNDKDMENEVSTAEEIDHVHDADEQEFPLVRDTLNRRKTPKTELERSLDDVIDILKATGDSFSHKGHEVTIKQHDGGKFGHSISNGRTRMNSGPRFDSKDAAVSHAKKMVGMISGASGRGKGEGSRGGKIIGHTKSGKPIYGDAKHSSHNTFNHHDHYDAMKAHQGEAKKILGKHGISNTEEHDSGYINLGPLVSSYADLNVSPKSRAKIKEHAAAVEHHADELDAKMGTFNGMGQIDYEARQMRKSEVKIPKKKFLAEHKRLINVLESPSHEDDKKEAKDQKKELLERSLDSLIMMADDPFDADTITNLHENSEELVVQKSPFRSGHSKVSTKKLPLMRQPKDPEETRLQRQIKKEAGLEKADAKPWPGEGIQGAGMPKKKEGGEGARGGKVVGHTSSGRPIYQKQNRPESSPQKPMQQVRPSGDVMGNAAKMQQRSRAEEALAAFKRSRKDLNDVVKNTPMVGSGGNSIAGTGIAGNQAARAGIAGSFRNRLGMNSPSLGSQISSGIQRVGNFISGKSMEKAAPKGVDPAKHERCVRKLKDDGHDIGSAYAICTSSLKRSELDECFDLIKAEKKKGRCWDGYEPTPGKKPYSEGSCRPAKKSFVTMAGPNGVVMDFGPLTGNPMADHANKILAENFDPVQNQTIRHQQEMYRKSLADYIAGKTTGDGARNDLTDPFGKLDKSFDEQTVEFLKNEGKGFQVANAPEVVANVGGEVVKAQSETDAMVLEMYKNEMAAMNDGGVIVDTVEKIIA